MRSYKSADQRRVEISEAALSLFTQQGYRKTTMEQIASSIAIARTSLYEYYKSKEDILYSLIESVVEEQPPQPLEEPVRTQLEYLASASIARLQNSYPLYQILFREFPTLETRTAEKMRAWQERSMLLVEKAISRGIHEGAFRPVLRVSDIAFAFRALVGQKLADLLLTGAKIQPEEEARRLIDLLWSGVGLEA